MADAQVALAEMMLNGRGGPASTAGALDLFEKAAAKGHAGAMFALGALHAGGHGMPADRPLAQQWFRAAAELGHGHAQMMLGRYLSSSAAGDQDDEDARVWLERAVAQGIAEAEPDLAALRASAREPLSATDRSQERDSTKLGSGRGDGAAGQRARWQRVSTSRPRRRRRTNRPGVVGPFPTAPVSTTLPTMLTVLTQTPPFRFG
jgi:TPR repeat protein